jgi:hypothetical protein
MGGHQQGGRDPIGDGGAQAVLGFRFSASKVPPSRGTALHASGNNTGFQQASVFLTEQEILKIDENAVTLTLIG